MNRTMKHTFIIILSVFLLSTCFVSSALSQEDNKVEYVYVSIRESTAGSDSKITVAYPNGQTEQIDVGTIKKSDAEDNARIINKLFNELGSDGYSLVSSAGGEYYIRYVFMK